MFNLKRIQKLEKAINNLNKDFYNLEKKVQKVCDHDFSILSIDFGYNKKCSKCGYRERTTQYEYFKLKKDLEIKKAKETLDKYRIKTKKKDKKK